MKKVLLLFLLVSCFQVFSQKIEFYKEYILFEITETQFVVDAMYFFRNISADTIKQFMAYPFSQHDDLGDVRQISVVSVYPEIDNEVIRNFNKKGAQFRLMIYPNDTALTNITYTQDIIRNQAEYILISTQAWNKPLEKATFTLKMPIEMKVDSLSYDADSLMIQEDFLFYKWQFTDFMPQTNFFVSFSKIEKQE